MMTSLAGDIIVVTRVLLLVWCVCSSVRRDTDVTYDTRASQMVRCFAES